MFDNVPESITRFFDFKAFARVLFMPDYDMGDGGHVFLTCKGSAPIEKEPPQGGFLSMGPEITTPVAVHL